METMSRVQTRLIFYTLNEKVTSISFYTLFGLVVQFQAVDFDFIMTNLNSIKGSLRENT